MNRTSGQRHADGQGIEELPEEIVELWQYSNRPSSRGIGLGNDAILSADKDKALRDLVS